jgi:hypothetical protein
MEYIVWLKYFPKIYVSLISLAKVDVTGIGHELGITCWVWLANCAYAGRELEVPFVSKCYILLFMDPLVPLVAHKFFKTSSFSTIKLLSLLHLNS